MSDNGQLTAEELYALPDSNFLLDPAAAAAYLQMVEAAKADGVTWAITETYRSLETQVFARKTKGGIMAPPGTSEHGWGKAIDLRTGKAPLAADRALPGGDPASNWLKQNAARFGFRTLSDKNEPWHWEYTGDPSDVATKRGQKAALKLDLDPNFILPNSGKPVPQRSIGTAEEVLTAFASPIVPRRRPDTGSAGMPTLAYVRIGETVDRVNAERRRAIAESLPGSGSRGDAAMSVTSRLGSLPDFSDSVAAPTLLDYAGAREAYSLAGLLDRRISMTAPNPVPVDLSGARPQGPQGRGGRRGDGAPTVESPAVPPRRPDTAPAAVSPVVPARRPDTAPAQEAKRETATLPSGKTVEVGRIYTIAGEDFIGGVKGGVGTLTKAPTSIVEEAGGKSMAGEAVRQAVRDETGKAIRGAVAAAPKMAADAAAGVSTVANNVGGFLGGLFGDIVSQKPKPSPIDYVRKVYQVDSYGRPIVDAPAVVRPVAKPSPTWRVQDAITKAKAAVSSASNAPAAAAKTAWAAASQPKASATVTGTGSTSVMRSAAQVATVKASAPMRSAAATVAARKLTVAQIAQEADNARMSGYREIQEMGPSVPRPKAAPAPAPKPVAPWYTPPSPATIPVAKPAAAPVPLPRPRPTIPASVKSAAPVDFMQLTEGVADDGRRRSGVVSPVVPGRRPDTAMPGKVKLSGAPDEKPASAPKPGPVSTGTVKPPRAVGPAAIPPRRPDSKPATAASRKPSVIEVVGGRRTASPRLVQPTGSVSQFLPNGVANPSYRDYSGTRTSEGGGGAPQASPGSFVDSLGGVYYDRHL